jgi:hypothetical protein
LTELVEQPGGSASDDCRSVFRDDLNTAVHPGPPSRRPRKTPPPVPVCQDSPRLRTASGSSGRHELDRPPCHGRPHLDHDGGRCPRRLAGTHLRNAIHTEVFSDQVNIVQARFAGRSASLLFTRGDGEKTVQ